MFLNYKKKDVIVFLMLELIFFDNLGYDRDDRGERFGNVRDMYKE